MFIHINGDMNYHGPLMNNCIYMYLWETMNPIHPINPKITHPYSSQFNGNSRILKWRIENGSFTVELSIKDGYFPQLFVRLPETTRF